LEVLESIKHDLVNHQKSGMSVMEMSHRSKEFMNIANEAEKNMRDIMRIPDDYKICFVQGGATLQFSAIPFNMFGQNAKADYLITGQWGEKAHKEAARYGTANEACNTKASKFTTIPDKSTWKLSADASYVQYCANETVNGVEWKTLPDVGDVPLIADMSSNFMSAPVDFAKHSVIFASLQKNVGPAGLTMLIAKPEFMNGIREMPMCPTYCSWKLCADNGSMYNTPACFSWYVMGEYLKYTKKMGGIAHFDQQAQKKSNLLYSIIDDSNGFYNCPVDASCRSRMNVPFKIMNGDQALEKKFIEEAKQMKLYTLAGHRSVGGVRASIYNGMPMNGVEMLGDFMDHFMDENRK